MQESVLKTLQYQRLESELYSPWSLVASILLFMGSFFGIIGSCWIIFQRHTSKSLLQNTIGLFITIIAYLDLVVCAYYIQKGLSSIPSIYFNFFLQHSDVSYAFEVIVTCSLISYAMLGLLLAFNTLYVVRFAGVSSFLDKNRWFGIFLCFISPFLCYYLPLYIAIRTQFFDVNPSCVQQTLNPCTDVKILSQVLLVSILSLLVLSTLLAYLVVIHTLKKNECRQSYMVTLLKQLGIVFSFTILVLWIPYLVRALAIVTFTGPQNNYYDEAHYGHFDAFTFLAMLRNLFVPMRGYFHALSVLYVFMAPFSKSCSVYTKTWNCLLFLMLASPLAKKEELVSRYTTLKSSRKMQEQVDTANSIPQLHWTVQDDASIDIECPETPVKERLFRFSQISLESQSSSHALESNLLKALTSIKEEEEVALENETSQ